MRTLAGLVIACAVGGIGFSGCGKQAFFVSLNQAAQPSPGFATIAPKVDIMLIQDDTGSMIAPYAQTSAQVSTFLSGLQSTSWDYHFTTVPLTSVSPITQAIASYYDGNWGSLWQPPYPGANINSPDNLSPSVFTLPADFDWKVTPSNSANGFEPGFESIYQNLIVSAQTSGFTRPDAMLVMLVMGNGNDNSQVNLCYRSDAVKLPNGTWSGVTEPCGNVGAPTCTTPFPQNYNATIIPYPYTGACDNSVSSYNSYVTAFSTIKGPGTQSQTLFYADVAQETSCLGGSAYIGTRYLQMSKQLSGTEFDICSTPLSTVLYSIASNMNTSRLYFRTHYLFIAEEPNPSSITVTRYIGGNTSQAVTVPQDPNNGWTYDGYLTNVYAIDYPTSMNLSSGYAIELHGTAELTGPDTANVAYTPYGVSNSAN